MRRELERIRTAQRKTEARDLLENPAARVGDVKVVRHRMSGSLSDLLRLSKELCADPQAIAILGADSAEGAFIVVSRGAEARIDVREAFERAIARIGGKGGGKPDFAQGKGPDAEALTSALEEAERIVRERLGSPSG